MSGHVPDRHPARAPIFYHDALRIRSPGVWLSEFNTVQSHLLIHSRTQPPFAVLLHCAVLNAARGDLAVLSLAFVLISSLTLPVMGLVFREIGADARLTGLLTLLLAVTPAFNIFGAVSLDGVFLVVATGLAGLFQREGRGRRVLLTALGISIVASVLALFTIHRVWGYDHVQAFLTASRLENRYGFLLVRRPLVYAMTRIEDVAEIVLFLSLGTAATMVRLPWR